jgi:hypothetical protein
LTLVIERNGDFTTAIHPVQSHRPDTIVPMSRVALYFASGESLYLGAALLLLVVVAPIFLKHTWMLRVRNVLAWVALAFMGMACPPFAVVVDVIFLAVFVIWFITSNQSSASQTSMRLQRGENGRRWSSATARSSTKHSISRTPSRRRPGGGNTFDDDSYFIRQGCEHCADGLGAEVYDLRGYRSLEDRQLHEFHVFGDCIYSQYYEETNMRDKDNALRRNRNHASHLARWKSPACGMPCSILRNDGDFQSCSITWAVLEVSHYFGGEAAGSRTAKISTRVWELRGHDADCFAEVCS